MWFGDRYGGARDRILVEVKARELRADGTNGGCNDLDAESDGSEDFSDRSESEDSDDTEEIKRLARKRKQREEEAARDAEEMAELMLPMSKRKAWIEKKGAKAGIKNPSERTIGGRDSCPAARIRESTPKEQRDRERRQAERDRDRMFASMMDAPKLTPKRPLASASTNIQQSTPPSKKKRDRDHRSHRLINRKKDRSRTLSSLFLRRSGSKIFTSDSTHK